jgi:hypothetical protein
MDINFEITEIKKSLSEVLNKVSQERGQSIGIKIYDISDLLRIFPVCKRTIASWMSEGILPHSKVGKKIFITQKDLDEFLEKYRTK